MQIGGESSFHNLLSPTEKSHCTGCSTISSSADSPDPTPSSRCISPLRRHLLRSDICSPFAPIPLPTHAVRQQPELARRMQTLIAPLFLTESPRNHHQRHSIERGIVVTKRTQRIGHAHETLRVPAGIEQQIEAVERTFELFVQFDGSVWRQIVATTKQSRGNYVTLH